MRTGPIKCNRKASIGRSLRITVSLTILGSSIHASSIANAQEDLSQPSNDVQTQNEDGVIIVTAQRRAQSVQEVPAAITALGSEALESRQITSISQLSAAVPNLQVASPYGTGSPPSFTIRGISSTDFTPNQSRPVAFYIDEGIRQLPLFEAMPLYDIERVEVLRGPQGTLYGKNATAGAVNIITRSPEFYTNGYASVGIGNFGRRESSGAVQIPLNDDRTVAARLAYTYTKDNGVIDQPGTDEDLEQTDQFAVRASLRALPTDSIDVVLRYNHFRSGGRNVAILASDINFASASFAQLNVLPGSQREGLGFFETQVNRESSREMEVDGLNATATFDLSPDVTLTSITTYDWGKWKEMNDGDGLPIDVFSSTIDATGVEQFVQEARLTGESGQLNWILGAMYTWDTVDIFQRYNYFFDSRCTIDCDFGIGDDVGFIQSNYFTQSRDSYAAYARFEYEVTDRLNVSGGARWSRDEVNIDNYQAFIGNISVPQLFETIPQTDLSESYNNVSFEAGLNYKFAPGILGYAAFQQGYRVGAFNGQAFNEPDEITSVQPEEADNWEVGLKSELLDRDLILNIAGFYTKYRNQQVISSEVASSGFQIFPLRSIDRSRVYGFEADMTARLTDDLTLALSAGYTDGEYTEGMVAGVPVDGNRITASARWSGNAAVDWRAAEFDGKSLNLHLDAAYQSRVFFDAFNSPQVSDDGHTVVNGQISLDGDRWSMSIWGQNLFNEKYFTYGLFLPTSGYNYIVRGVPRTIGIRGRINF